jgi:hypothetical protein
MYVDLTEAERRAVLLALARLAAEHPGWGNYLTELALKLRGGATFEEFLGLARDGAIGTALPRGPRTDDQPIPGPSAN